MSKNTKPPKEKLDSCFFLFHNHIIRAFSYTHIYTDIHKKELKLQKGGPNMKYKHIIHDKSIFLLIFSIAMTLAFFTFGVVFYLSVHEEGSMDFHYENEKDFILVGREESSQSETVVDENGTEYEIDKRIDYTPAKNTVETMITYLCGIKNCNVSMDAMCTVGPANKPETVKIYFNTAEDVSEKLMQEYFSDIETNEPYAFIGSELSYMMKNGSINVNAQNIRVAGILENRTIHDDNRIVLINAIQNPGIREAVINTLAGTGEYSFIHFGSNMGTFQTDDLATTKKHFETLNRVVEIRDEIETMSVNGMDETLGELTDKIFIGLTIFSLINLISLDVVWFSRKRKDIAIMKTYGYSTNQLIATFAKEYILAVIAGSALSLSISTIWYVFTDKKAIWGVFQEAYLYSIFLILFIVFMMLLFVAHYAENTAPADGIKDR